MKTTVELPDELFIEIKLRAVSQGRKLKDEIESLLRNALAELSRSPALTSPGFAFDTESGLPFISGGKAPVDSELRPEELSAVLLDQEVKHFREAS